MNPLLLRQLKKCGIDPHNVPPELKEIVNSISQAYDGFTEDRKMIERSFDLSSEELTFKNKELQKEILERRKIEEQLDLERKQLLSIFDGMDDVVYVADPKTYEMLYMNGAAKKAWGDRVGEKCHLVLQNLDAPCPFCTNDKIFGSYLGRSYSWEFQNKINHEWYRCIDRVIDWPDGRKVRLEIAININEQKETEKALRESEKKYRLITENARELICVATFDLELKLLYASPSHRSLLGYEPGEVLGRSAWDFIHPDDKSKGLALLRSYLGKKMTNIFRPGAKPLVEIFEFRFKHKDETWRFFETTVNQIEHKLLFSSRDITEKKRAEVRIKRLNQCFISFGSDPNENINALTGLAGELLGGTCALYNRLQEGMLCSLGQWQPPPDYVPEDKPEGHICYDVIQKSVDDIFVVRDLQNSEYAKKDPNVGPYKLETYVGYPVKHKGEAVGSLCVVYQRAFEPQPEDKEFLGILASAISVEEERREAQERERTYRQKISLHIEQTPLGAIQWDAELKAVEWNPAAERIFGYTKEEAIGKKATETILQGEVYEEVRTVWEDLWTRKGGWKNTNHNTRKDGQQILCEWYNTALVDDKGNTIGIAALVQDITENKKAEDQVREKVEELERANKLMQGRELRIIELKEKIAKLEEESTEKG